MIIALKKMTYIATIRFQISSFICNFFLILSRKKIKHETKKYHSLHQ